MGGRRGIAVWPPVIAVCEACYQIVCPTCGIFDAPFSYVVMVNSCPICGRMKIDTRSTGHAHWWVMRTAAIRKGLDGDRDCLCTRKPEPGSNG